MSAGRLRDRPDARGRVFVLLGYALLVAALPVISAALLGVDFGFGRLKALF